MKPDGAEAIVFHPGGVSVGTVAGHDVVVDGEQQSP
jgi:hypothetical protein